MKFTQLVLPLIFLISVGCEKFVDIAPPTILRQDQYFNKANDFKSAVNGLYSSLRGYYDSYYLYSEIPSDNSKVNGFTLAQSDMDQMSWYPSYGPIQNLWVNSYRTIARANIIIQEMIGFEDIDTEVKMQYIAESKFIRALMYFNLVQFYGDVPLILAEIQTEEEAYSYERVSREEVYEQITQDLIDAGNSLPGEYGAGEIGKATRWAALSLLGKVYVTNKKYNEAIPILEQVLQSNEFVLLPDYQSIFSTDNENNEEIIFAVQYLGGSGFGEGSGFSLRFAPRNSDISSGGVPNAANEGTLDLWNAFEERDKRKEYSIGYLEETNVYYTKKFLDKPIAPNEGENDWIVLRYSEILLLYAEALNESEATMDAFVPLNEVRVRAGLPELNNLNQSELKTAILQERRVELCFEGKRWLDLIRTETMVSTMTNYKNKYIDTDQFAQHFVIEPSRSIFPIPFREISLNPNLTQNPGYD